MTHDPITPVTYEAFGAAGDGVQDDIEAIAKAHDFANQRGLPIKTDPAAIYYIGPKAWPVTIATDTDWSTSRFTIQDRGAEDREQPVFRVVSLLEPIELPIERLERDQKTLAHRPPVSCFVRVEASGIRRYMRMGLNENPGFPQSDSFILHPDGQIEGSIDWDYPEVTRVEANPIDSETLMIRGGIFTTIANDMHGAPGYFYWSRNLSIRRSNTEVVGLTHYVSQETAKGSPYGGFLAIKECAQVTLRDCFVTGHRTYVGIGSAGKPVNMGTYDITGFDVVGLKLLGVKMNHIRDANLWGVIETSFCKNVLIEDCVLSRMDTHMGISGTYTIRRTILGHAGFNAIGRGLLQLEDVTCYGQFLVNFRTDFGNTWDGDLVIRNCKWVPGVYGNTPIYLFCTDNNGRHDFGYPCRMPRTITIEGLEIDDSRHPTDRKSVFVFLDHPDASGGTPPHPYGLSEKLRLKDVSIASGRTLQVSATPRLVESIPIEEIS